MSDPDISFNSGDTNNVLLNLGLEITQIKSGKQLRDFFHRRLRNVFGYQYATIYLVEPDSNAQVDYFSSLALQNHFSPFLSTVQSTDFDHSSLSPYLKEKQEAVKWKAVKQDLYQGERLYGQLILLYAENELPGGKYIQMLQTTGAFIVSAIDHIKTAEKAAIREHEGKELLKLSEELASIKNRNDFFLVINQSLRQILPIDRFGIANINDDGQTYSAFVLEFADETRKVAGFDKVVSSSYSIKDPIFTAVTAAGEAVVFDVAEMVKMPGIPEYVKFWNKAGYRHYLTVPLRVGSKYIGLMHIHFEDKNAIDTKSPLLKGICTQIAQGVCNILASEKVISQINLINKYKQQLEEEKIYLKEEVESHHNYSEIIGNTSLMQDTLDQVSEIVNSDSTVLILGETGTGKELIARAIHNNSTRKERLFVKVNCTALPSNLIESELFGHERGSFAGATERRAGKFELANNGTLFLDEVAELSPELQVKLLRVLQEKEVSRIGAKNPVKIDVRIIAATNRNLEKEIAEGRFRSDLFYWLNIFPISMPPLRSRTEDIPVLANHFMEKFSKKIGREITKISNGAMQELLYYHWPGNIRELAQMIERSILLTSGNTITSVPVPAPQKQISTTASDDYLAVRTIDENERDHILKVLKYCNGRIAGEGGAAQRLGVPTSTLSSKIKRLGIRKEHYKE